MSIPRFSKPCSILHFLLSSCCFILHVSAFKLSEPLICVVIRTYWKHGDGALVRMIESLQAQTHKRWDAQILIMDNDPFLDVNDILHSFGDDRLWLFANWVGEEYEPKNEEGHWRPQYHKQLYNLTDSAARACPAETRWVLFTNGDNMYHKNAFREIAKASKADVVALDFYSRYTRPTGIPCERFQGGANVNPCKRNRMKWCHTDLGAVAYNWPKLVEQDLRFGTLSAPKRFTSEDALMAELVVEKGWKLHSLDGQCLYDQGPNPVTCALKGGIWDDRSSFMPSGFGGNCLLDKTIEDFEDEEDVTEVVIVPLAHDGQLSGFPDSVVAGKDLANLTIECLRPADDYRFVMMRAFGEECLEDIDEPLFAEYMEEVCACLPSSQTPLSSCSWKFVDRKWCRYNKKLIEVG